MPVATQDSYLKLTSSSKRTVSSTLSKAILDRGFSTVKECSVKLGIPYALLSKVIYRRHIPGDSNLLLYASRLGVDPGKLIRLAHYEKAPPKAKAYLKAYL